MNALLPFVRVLIIAVPLGWPAAAQLFDSPRLAESDTPPRVKQSGITDVEVLGHVLRPEQLTPTPERIANLKMPDGFELQVFAEGLGNPRILAVADNNDVYVTRRSGDVMLLKDTDGDGRADFSKVAAERPGVHGIAIDGDTVYLATVKEVLEAKRDCDGTLFPLALLIDDLPDGGQHHSRMIAVGPDGALFVSIGSTCNDCNEPNPESASILRIEPENYRRTIFASGLRNTLGFAFHPTTGELYGMDHGIDWLGDHAQPEELNHLQQGHKYGWPFVYADKQHNPNAHVPPGKTIEELAKNTTDPVDTYTPHAAPIQLTFYTGDRFPEEYRGDAFIAMRGSWNRKPPSGYEVVRIKFEDNKPAGFEPFITGFLVATVDGGWGHLGRLAGLAQTPDGALLLSDDTNGVIYRIAYTGKERNEGPDPRNRRAKSEY